MTDVANIAASKKKKSTEAVEVFEGRGQDDGETEEEEEEIVEEEDPYATSAIFVNTDVAADRREKSEKDLNSPDSNDSGIQADVQSFQQLSDDLDLYAVVKKPKRKIATDAVEEDLRIRGETVEKTEEPSGVSSRKLDDIPVEKESKLDDPYASVEFDSPDEETGESAYAAVQKKTRVLRIGERNDDDDDEIGEHEHNDNNYCHTKDGDGSDDDDKLSDSSDLPEGWQKHEDEQGSYYWHIRSGITQRDPPSPVLQTLPAAKKSNAKTFLPINGDVKVKVKTKKDSCEIPVVADVKIKPRQNVFSAKFDDSSQSGFLVHCLGSLPLTEEELTDDRSGHAINQCISSLSHRSGALQNGRLQGRNLYLEFSGDDLLLVDVNTGSLVHSESVKSVRVWGVGREKDSRDFAYVARDPESNKHVCWVFKCRRTGHEVATALRSTCLRILKKSENYPEKKSSPSRLTESSGTHLAYESCIGKESQKNQNKNWNDQSRKSGNGQSKHWNDSVVFPVPMSESKKVINCHYLGMMKVPKPLGMEILNDAIEMIFAGVPSSKWVAVSVEVAPSAVTVYDRGCTSSAILECRIRFLTFLGIGINNCKLSAFIMHSAQNEFFAHVFHCIPDAGIFCRTIKAACKLRYQKCLDAQTQKDRERGKTGQTSSGSFAPFQGLKESLQKGVSNLFGGDGKKQQH